MKCILQTARCKFSQIHDQVANKWNRCWTFNNFIKRPIKLPSLMTGFFIPSYEKKIINPPSNDMYLDLCERRILLALSLKLLYRQSKRFVRRHFYLKSFVTRVHTFYLLNKHIFHRHRFRRILRLHSR